jgi:DNA-directed RNA polymerase subunit RPC12/RpoP
MVKCSKCGEEVALRNGITVSFVERYGIVCPKCLSNRDSAYSDMPYTAYLKTDRWRGKADECRRLAGHRCRLCNSNTRIEVHHRTYERRGLERQDDLTALCRTCHQLYTAYDRGLIEIPELDDAG